MKATEDEVNNLPFAVTVLDDEPRIRDLDLAERLGFDRPRKIRELVTRYKDEIETFGTCPTLGRVARGNAVSEHYLNEEQALLIATVSNAPAAPRVRRALITTFVALRRGQAPVLLEQPDRKVIGGIVKGVIHKELTETVEAFKSELQDMMDRANRRIGSLEYVPVLDVLKEHDIPAKGRRGLSQRCSALLRRYSLLHKFPMRESGETGRWLYHVEAIKAWVQDQGIDIFRRHKAKLAGDGELFRVVEGGKAATR